MHINPFGNVVYDLQDLRNQIQRKADQNEIYTLRSFMDSLERSLREASSEIDGLRRRCERLEEVVRELNPAVYF